MKGKDKPKKVQKKDKKIRPEAQGKVSEKYHVTPLDSSLISFSLSSSPSFYLCCPRRRIHEDGYSMRHKVHEDEENQSKLGIACLFFLHLVTSISSRLLALLFIINL